MCSPPKSFQRSLNAYIHTCIYFLACEYVFISSLPYERDVTSPLAEIQYGWVFPSINGRFISLIKQRNKGEQDIYSSLSLMMNLRHALFKAMHTLPLLNFLGSVRFGSVTFG